MTSEDGKVLVHTREGADNRKNGIAIYTLDDPLASETRVGVHRSGHVGRALGVREHAGQVRTLRLYHRGRNGAVCTSWTSTIPRIQSKSRRGKRRGRTRAGTFTTSTCMTDLLYASYLSDGLVILDVGNGIKGGSPSNPQLVSQFKYDLLAQRYRRAGGAAPR